MNLMLQVRGQGLVGPSIATRLHKSISVMVHTDRF